MEFWRIEPTPVRARAWMLEGFEHLGLDKRDFPKHLEGIEKELKREWVKQNKVTSAGTKRKGDADASTPASKKTKTTTKIKTERNSQPPMPPPPTKPLGFGDVRGKYVIGTDFACCDEQSDPAHNYMCNIVLSPGGGETMPSYFNLGQLMCYKIFTFFEKCPTEASSQRVWFRWRGTKSDDDEFEEYRGDNNHGWVRFVGGGKIEVWFDKLGVHLYAQKKGKGGLGEAMKHDPRTFWKDWHDYDEEVIDVLDTLLLLPDW
ncbi:hypothetical protein FLONG3_5143 [Fusarium longipes]|uniref:Uncharacterized protein n=1 Tax=Fusarium longipes TaxID=694270 RepID=A0A395SW64_9HYPO|nr:hypothetical protein FLONG3_5143 [Fusarium longipes]